MIKFMGKTFDISGSLEEYMRDTCVICKAPLKPSEQENGVCRICDMKMEKQLDTGRCSWCGRLVGECICEEIGLDD